MNAEIKKAKIDYITSEVDNDKGDSSRSWKAINMLLGRKSKVFGVNELTVDQSLIIYPNLIANAFNEHFSTICSKISSSVQNGFKPIESYVKPSKSKFEFSVISAETNQNLLATLSVSKAYGLDRISARILKYAGPVISLPLSYIFNKSIVSAIFPDNWKNAKVFPVYKGNSRNDPNNYRHISVLPVVAKVFEKLVFEQK